MTEETKEGKPKKPRLSRPELRAKKEAEVKAEVMSELSETTKASPLTFGPSATKRRGSVAARIEVAFPNILEFAADVATGKIRASREQVTMLRDLMDRRFGRSPETHIVGSMDSEQREAAAALTKEQLLGLLDAGSGPLATEVATDVVQGTVVTEETT